MAGTPSPSPPPRATSRRSVTKSRPSRPPSPPKMLRLSPPWAKLPSSRPRTKPSVARLVVPGHSPAVVPLVAASAQFEAHPCAGSRPPLWRIACALSPAAPNSFDDSILFRRGLFLDLAKLRLPSTKACPLYCWLALITKLNVDPTPKRHIFPACMRSRRGLWHLSQTRALHDSY